MYSVHPPPGIVLHPLGHGPGHAVNAAHGGHNPKLVADSHPAVRPAVALKGARPQGGRGPTPHLSLRGARPIQPGSQVVGVHPLARLVSVLARPMG